MPLVKRYRRTYLDRLLSSVHVVAQEERSNLPGSADEAEEALQVRQLPVDVAKDHYGRLHFDERRHRLEHFEHLKRYH